MSHSSSRKLSQVEDASNTAAFSFGCRSKKPDISAVVTHSDGLGLEILHVGQEGVRHAGRGDGLADQFRAGILLGVAGRLQRPPAGNGCMPYTMPVSSSAFQTGSYFGCSG